MVGQRDRALVWLSDYRARWLRPLVVVGILAGSAGWAPRASAHQVTLLAGLALLLALLRWPLFALMAVVPASELVPFTLDTGTETAIHAGVALLAVAAIGWLLQALRRHELGLLPSRPIAPLLVLCAIACVSFVVGLQPWLPMAQTASLAAQLGGLAIFLFSAIALLLVPQLMPSPRWLALTVAMFLAVGAVYMLQRAGVPFLSGVTIVVRGSDGGMFWLWIVALALSQGLVNRQLPSFARVGLVCLAVLTLGVGVVQLKDWSSGWVPGLLAAGIILWLAAPRIALPLTLAAGVVMLWKLPTLLDLYVVNDYKQYDLLTRVAAWEILWKIVWVEPILGTGFANYYWYTPLFPILGYYVQFNSHNNYIDLLAQTGFVGLATFAWLMAESGLLAWRLRRTVADGFARAYVYGVLGGLCGTVVSAFLGDWVLPFVYNVGVKGFRASVLPWLFLGGLLLVERVSRASAHPATAGQVRDVPRGLARHTSIGAAQA